MRHFDDFALNEETGELFRAGERLPLSGKAIHLLVMLTERPGELLPRRELHARLWSDETFVDFDTNLNVTVRRLRAALGDSAVAPRYVETLPRRGLRFVGRLDLPAGPGTRTSRTVRLARWPSLGAAVMLAGAMAAGTFWYEGRPPATVTIEGFRNLSGQGGQDFVSEGLGAELTVALAARTGPGIVLVRPAAGPARYLVRGTSRQDVSGLYVTAELVDRETGAYVWAESFTCPRRDLFRIQRQMASKIGERLRAVLTAG